MISCPSCGASDETDEATLSGTFGPEAQHSWSMQLLFAALEKALGLGRVVDADRILRRASALFEERVASGGNIEKEQMAPLAHAAARICEETRDPHWGVWISNLYVQTGGFPPAQVLDRLVLLRVRHAEMREPIERLLALYRELEALPSSDDREALQRLTRAHRGTDERADRPTADPFQLS
jgi:hypothetical protein